VTFNAASSSIEHTGTACKAAARGNRTQTALENPIKQYSHW